ncbi:MAG TPA: hypothetical protein VJ804_11355 [Acidimicrobiales bacterium]|nr:hypothetical protein [Acidimicrobiales bacterium]
MTRGRTRTLVLALALGAGATACSDDGGSDEELCALVEDTTAYDGRFGEGLDPTDTERALEQLESARADLTRLRAAAPSAVDDALDDELAYVDALIEVLETVDPTDPVVVVNAVNALEEERAAADVAALELQAWAEETC